MGSAWFVDGSYLFKIWQSLQRPDKLDYLKLRLLLEKEFCDQGERIEDAYYFSADPDPPTARLNAFHSAISFPPPSGPGLRVKLYWLQKKQLYWPSSMGGHQVLHPHTHTPYELSQQKGVDVGLAFHLMRSYNNKRWNKLFLAAGDGDFHEVIQHLVEVHNIFLVLIGTMNSINDELRPYANHILSVEQYANAIAR